MGRTMSPPPPPPTLPGSRVLGCFFSKKARHATSAGSLPNKNIRIEETYNIARETT